MKLFTPSEVEVEGLQHPKASWPRRVIKIAINTFSSLCEQCRGAGWGPLKGNSNKQTVRLQTTSSQLGSWPGRWQEGECLGSSDLGLLSAPLRKHKCLSCLPGLREEAVCLLQSLRYLRLSIIKQLANIYCVQYDANCYDRKQYLTMK